MLKMFFRLQILVAMLLPIVAQAQAERWLTQEQCSAAGGKWEPDQRVLQNTGAPLQLCIVPLSKNSQVKRSGTPAYTPHLRTSGISGLGGGISAAGEVLSAIADALGSSSATNPYEEARLRREAQAAQEQSDLKAEAQALDQQARALAARGQDDQAYKIFQKAWAISGQSGYMDHTIYDDLQLIQAKIDYNLAQSYYQRGDYRRASVMLSHAASYAASAQKSSLSELIMKQNDALQRQASHMPQAERQKIRDASRPCYSVNGEMLCQ